MNFALNQGFENESLDAAVAFRVLLDAMARPGIVHPLPEKIGRVANLNRGSTLAMLTLTDHETPIWLDDQFEQEAVSDFIRFHCSSPIVTDPAKAMFAFWASTPTTDLLAKFPIGTPAYPDNSATLVIQVEALIEGKGTLLTGPGIKTHHQFLAEGLDDAFWIWWRLNSNRFPLGLDVILTTDTSLAALPRTAQIREIA